MMAAMAAFTGNDTLIKAVTREVPLFQAILIRGVFTLILLAVLARLRGGLALAVPRGDRLPLSLRTMGEIGSTLFFLSALQHMPLAQLAAIMQSLPLVVTLLAAILFGERIGWRRVAAICVGFFGVLLIIRPGAEGFNAWSIAGLAAMGSVALRDLSTRKLSRDTSSLAVTVYAAMAVTLLGAVVSPFQGWIRPDAGHILTLAAAAIFLLAGYQFVIAAMRVGDVGIVAPFRYTSLVWAILLGWITFGNLPEPLTLLGGAIVIASGLFTLYRERRVSTGGGAGG